MEQLHEGYVAAIAATAGVSAQFVGRDMYKYDVEFVRQPDINVEEVSFRAQLKATTTIAPPAAGATSVSYQFTNKSDYEALAMPRSTQKRLLILLVVHPNQNRWTYAHHRSLLVRHCCYWLNMEGMSSTAASPTVSVPTANVFNADALTGILDRIHGGLPLCRRMATPHPPALGG